MAGCWAYEDVLTKARCGRRDGECYGEVVRSEHSMSNYEAQLWKLIDLRKRKQLTLTIF